MNQVGQYTLLKNIGSGQFGHAYMVRHAITGRTLCMKQISITAENQESSMKEAQVLAQLAGHDMKNINVVRYEESFIDRENLCIVMELCEGDLDTEIKKHKAHGTTYTEDEIMETFVQVLMGLSHIHNNRILHRDLKTQNIFLSKGGIVKLGDLGIAKVVESTLEQCKSFVGTPYYMAPEVCSSSPYTSQADMWSLGCVLYELCTLQHAFSADSLYALIFRIINGGYEPIDQTRYSSSLSRLVATLLDKDPACRPSCRSLLGSQFIQMHIHKTMSKVLNQATVAGELMRSRGQRDCKGQAALGLLGKPPASSIATPATPKEQLKARKLAEAARRMREVTLQIHTTAHEKERARERKEEMLQGTAHRSDCGARVDQQHRSRSCHARELNSRSADGAVSRPRSHLVGWPESASAVTPESQPPLRHTAGVWSAPHVLSPCRPRGDSLESGQGISNAQNVQSGSALSHDDRLAYTGAASYNVHANGGQEEDWAEENAKILAGGVDPAAAEHGRAGASSMARPQNRLSALHIPCMEGTDTPATPTVPSTTQSTDGTPTRFGMDTQERKQFGAMAGGLHSPPGLPVSPLCSPVIRFGTDLSCEGGCAFAFPQTPTSAASGGLLCPSHALSGAVSEGGPSPQPQVEQLRATNSTDYSDDYSEDYDSEQSGSSEGVVSGAMVAPVRGQTKALLENLLSAQGARVGTDEEAEIIADEEPSGAVLLTLRSSGIKEMCRAALGRSFEKAYEHCRSRYLQDGVDMREVHAELLHLVDLPEATRRGAVQQLEVLVYQELYG